MGILLDARPSVERSKDWGLPMLHGVDLRVLRLRYPLPVEPEDPRIPVGVITSEAAK